MPAVQKQFEQFHDAIKLEADNEKAKLQEKRDILLKALKAGLKEDDPGFESFHQGSYSMHTGVKPLDGNFDIDIDLGVIFDCKQDRYEDPVELKKLVRDALQTNVRTVKIRRPCVTVNYMTGDTVNYHVDLAVYVKRDDGKLDLAKGKENSDAAYRVWEVSDPKELTNIICTAFSDDKDLAQYRRCIRYIKRWRHVQFASGGAPLSIALTVAAKNWFQPYFNLSGKAGDLRAMLNWVETMLSQFSYDMSGEEWHDRLKVWLPVAPNTDLMAKMTKGQMESFQEKLKALRDALKVAEAEELPEDACKKLRKQFGDDFPIPPKEDTAKSVASAVISTGSSA